MVADSPPDDVGIARCLLRATVKNGSSIWRPGHLEDTTPLLHGFDTQSRTEALTFAQVFDYVLHGDNKQVLLGRGESGKLAEKLRKFLMRRHQALPHRW